MAKFKRKKKKSSVTSIDTVNSKEAKKLNKGYNKQVTPKSDQNNMDHMPGSDNSEISIGTSDPVKKFKKWNGDYWKLD